MTNELEVTEHFKSKLRNLSKAPKKKIAFFVKTFQEGGFYAIDNVTIDGRTVRNKKSDNIPSDDPEFIAKVQFAQKHKLWHFHAGFL